MKLPIYHINAFAEEEFAGNPAAVVILKDWVDNSLLQKISAQNNLSETAFIVPMNNYYEIKWFTPEVEVDLCGHATLAASYVVHHFIQPEMRKIRFLSHKAGNLWVEFCDERITLDFPADKLVKCEKPIPTDLLLGIGKEPEELYKGRNDFLLVYDDARDIMEMQPDFDRLKRVDAEGIIATAPGDKADFVSRFFAPAIGINEDPVTGSAHTLMVPYWFNKTGKKTFAAQQLSKRGGRLYCEYLEHRIKISGRARLYLSGEIYI